MAEILRWALLIVQGLVGIMSLGLLFAFIQVRHLGVLLAAIVYFGCTVISFQTASWWPFLAAFALTWVLRLIGLDPGKGR